MHLSVHFSQNLKKTNCKIKGRRIRKKLKHYRIGWIINLERTLNIIHGFIRKGIFEERLYYGNKGITFYRIES